MKRRDVVRRLEAAGFRVVRDSGDHTIYQKAGFRPVQVPQHRELNENTAKGILKIAGLEKP